MFQCDKCECFFEKIEYDYAGNSRCENCMQEEMTFVEKKQKRNSSTYTK